MKADVLSLVLFVPDGDISPFLQQHLADVWVTHLGCQHQRCPAILEMNTHTHTHNKVLKNTIKNVPHLKSKSDVKDKELSFKVITSRCGVLLTLTTRS